MVKLEISFEEEFCPTQNMARFKATMLSIFERYATPLGADETKNLDKMDGAKPDGSALSQEIERSTDSGTFSGEVAEEAQGNFDVIVTPIADKQGCIPLRNLSELEAGKRYSVDLDILIDEENLPKYYELQLKPEQSDFTRKEKFMDFQKRNMNNIGSLCSNGSYCFSSSTTSQSKPHFTGLQKDLHKCDGNDSLSRISPMFRHQQIAEENENCSLTTADEDTDISEIYDSSLIDSFTGFIKQFCRKTNISLRAKFYRQSNWFSRRRSLKLSIKRLNRSTSSNLSVKKYVSATKNWANTPMSRWTNTTNSSYFTSFLLDGRNEGTSDVHQYGNKGGLDKQSQTTSIQPSTYYKLLDKNTGCQCKKFCFHEYAQSPRFKYPNTPNANLYGSEQIQSPTSSNAVFQQQDFCCTFKSLNSTSKSPQTSNFTSETGFLLEAYDNSKNKYKSLTNSLYPLNVEQEDSFKREKADQYGLKAFQILSKSEMNKPFMIYSFDDSKTDDGKNEDVMLPIPPTMMHATSNPFSAHNQPGQAVNKVANLDYESTDTLPSRLVLPFNLKNQLSFRIQEKESDFDKIFRALCMDNCSKFSTFKKICLSKETPDLSEQSDRLKRKSDLPNDNSLKPTAKRLRGEPSDDNSSDIPKSFFKEALLFPHKNKASHLQVNAESRSQASRMDNHAKFQLKLNYDGSQKMKDVRYLYC